MSRIFLLLVFFVLIVNLAYFTTNTIVKVKIKIFKSRNTKSLDKNLGFKHWQTITWIY